MSHNADPSAFQDLPEPAEQENALRNEIVPYVGIIALVMAVPVAVFLLGRLSGWM